MNLPNLILAVVLVLIATHGIGLGLGILQFGRRDSHDAAEHPDLLGVTELVGRG